MTDLVARLRELLTLATPGPWAVNPFAAQIDSQQTSDLGGLLPIAQMLWPTDERSEDETTANAHLIAEMKGALPAILKTIEAQTDRITALEAENVKLRVALKPFADRATIPDSNGYLINVDYILADIEAQGFVVVPREPTEAMQEAACRAHCDYFGGDGWWDSGLIADTKPKAIEAMRVAYSAMIDAGKAGKEG